MKLFTALFALATGTEWEMYISANNLQDAQAEADDYARDWDVELLSVTAF